VVNAVFITVRNSSKRLPNKAILEVLGQVTSIEVVIERAQLIGEQVILVTSTDDSDDVFVDIADRHGIKIFRGSLHNKIKRWFDCANYFNIDNAVLVDGDDLMYDYDIAKRSLQILASSSKIEIVKHPDNVVCGYFTYTITRKGLEKIFHCATDESMDTDVITEFLLSANLETHVIQLNEWEKNRNFRLTLDYPEDLAMFSHLLKDVPVLIKGKDLSSYLDKNQQVVEINLSKHNDYLNNQKNFNKKVKNEYC